MLNFSKFIAVLATALALAACGGGGSTSPVAPTQVVTSNLSVPVTSNITAALSAQPFTFLRGIPALGTTGTTTVVFSGTSTTPSFSVSSAGGTATGFVTFGSCIFNVTGVSGSIALSVGQTIRIDPCSLSANTAGFTVGQTQRVNTVLLLLGSNGTSQEIDQRLNISADGTVSYTSPFGTQYVYGRVGLQLVTGS